VNAFPFRERLHRHGEESAAFLHGDHVRRRAVLVPAVAKEEDRPIRDLQRRAVPSGQSGAFSGMTACIGIANLDD
jgi:hypothetical protein